MQAAIANVSLMKAAIQKSVDSVPRLPDIRTLTVIGLGCFVLLGVMGSLGAQTAAPHQPAGARASTPRTLAVKGAIGSYSTVGLPFLQKYCLACHATKIKRGSLDLERFHGVDDIRKDLKPWRGVVEHLEIGDMPPPQSPQPADGEKRRLVAWVRSLLDAEAMARAGDPGSVPLRRLSNAEYDCTIRDLTGVDLRPTREFPADGAAGEGFTNAAEALTDISPALLTKYFTAAKEIADHAVLLPDGFRFSSGKTRRDWTDESTAKLRAFYASCSTPDGSLPVAPYLAATVRHRGALSSGKAAVAEIAKREHLSAKYLRILWRTLNDKTPSYPLDEIRASWRTAEERDVPALAAVIVAWQATLWQTARVGSYVRPVGKGFAESTTRQIANDPPMADAQTLRLAVKPEPGQSEVVLHLTARENGVAGTGRVVWQRPRFEAAGMTPMPPLLLSDYASFGPDYEIDARLLFTNCSKYMAAAIETVNDHNGTAGDIAPRHGLDRALLDRWVAVLGLEPFEKRAPPHIPGRSVSATALEPLNEKIVANGGRPAINGWRRMGADLPVLVTNTSDTVENIPGLASPHGVMVHPTPTEFVAVAWKSPVTCGIRVTGKVSHAHPACGNGVSWWITHRRAAQTVLFGEGAIEVGKSVEIGAPPMNVQAGDVIVLAVDAKDGNHSCDLTRVDLRIAEMDGAGRTWDLAHDIADSVTQGNPHDDSYGAHGVWYFAKGLSRVGARSPASLIPPGSVMDRWRNAAADSTRLREAASLAERVQSLLSGPRPAKATEPDRALYDNLLAANSPFLQNVDLVRLAKAKPAEGRFGLPSQRFGGWMGKTLIERDSLVTGSGDLEIRLPAALFRDREFVVEGRLETPSDARAVMFQVAAAPPGLEVRWDGHSPVVASKAGYAGALQGFARFRECFPLFVCFPPIIPNDEVVSLKTFHREDEPLKRLFLDDEQARRLDRLWAEHRLISGQPITENTYLPLFIGFVTQDQPKEMVTFFEGQRPAFKARAEAFEADLTAAIPKQLNALVEFAARARRGPLPEKEKSELLGMYRILRAKGAAHEEALRGVLSRLLVSPAFLFRIERAPSGARPGEVSDWELASRLSYFLWSTAPDDDLRRLAASGRLRDPNVLAAQTQRMLKDDRVRELAVEFGAQWLQVRGFDALNEKNERLFPTFDAGLRKSIYEETILFFQDLFQSDRSVTTLLDTDYTFLNETLAKHYGIPGVAGPQWRRVGGVRRYGRGGVLGLASMLTKEAGASRTSPILRGNWLVETLLGEKLPRPPANVPKLPEEEGGDGLTLRQQVEKHTRTPECAVCHTRIDPFGFALERYDPIGRFRDRDLSGLPVDAKAKLKTGARFEGIEGLRTYLLTEKKQVIARLFCRRLLGYALGRSVINSDRPLIDAMTTALNSSDGRISSAVQVIVGSPQF